MSLTQNALESTSAVVGLRSLLNQAVKKGPASLTGRVTGRFVET